MNCAEVSSVLSAYLDGELDALRSREVEAHLQECTACARRWSDLEALRESLRAPDLRYAMPPGLESRVRRSLRRETGTPVAPFRMALAAAALLVVGVFGGRLLAPAPTGALASDLVSAHMRALLPDRLIDVASSDRHTVKPYFQGKLDYAPPVPDLEASEFSLVGGRVDVIGAHRVAALVYKRRQHVINVFVYPVSWGIAPPRPEAIEGYSVRAFSEGGFEFCSVSDADPSELERLPALIAQALAPR